MAQSLANILIHLVFSTKNREKWISSDIEKQLYCYMITTCKSHKCPVIAIGGTEDHLHICCNLSRTITISKIVERIKTGTSKWIKAQNPCFKQFSWKNGYGAFSVGASNVNALKKYIANQKEHHRKITFKDEFREFLKRYNINYDEKYVWD